MYGYFARSRSTWTLVAYNQLINTNLFLLHYLTAGSSYFASTITGNACGLFGYGVWSVCLMQKPFSCTRRISTVTTRVAVEMVIVGHYGLLGMQNCGEVLKR